MFLTEPVIELAVIAWKETLKVSFFNLLHIWQESLANRVER